MTDKKTSGKGNPAWIRGGKSPNTAGRRGFGRVRKNSSEEIRAIMARVFKKNYSAQKVNKMIAGLKTDKEKLEVAEWLASYLVPKHTSLTVGTPFDDLSDNDLDKMLTKILRPAQSANALQEPIQTKPGQVLFLNSPIVKENGTNGQSQEDSSTGSNTNG